MPHRNARSTPVASLRRAKARLATSARERPPGRCCSTGDACLPPRFPPRSRLHAAPSSCVSLSMHGACAALSTPSVMACSSSRQFPELSLLEKHNWPALSPRTSSLRGGAMGGNGGQASRGALR
eukprot:scaffold130709_cov39-Phaeocystis_antarctica.AAC.1